MMVVLVSILVVQSFALGGLAAWVIIVGRRLKKIDRDADFIRSDIVAIGLKIAGARLEAAFSDIGRGEQQ